MPPCSEVGRKPVGYPLPWCAALGMAYWEVNITLCLLRAGWREWQREMSMQQIIPEIDALMAVTTPTGDQS